MSLPIMSADKKLTWKQRRLVERHIHVADRAGHWLTRCYRAVGWTPEEAQSDAYAWLVFSALRYNPAKVKGAKFQTYYLANVKWWRSDVRSLKPAEIRKWQRTASLEHIASLSENEGGAYNMDCLAIENNKPAMIDQAEVCRAMESLILEMVPYGQYLIDIADGMSVPSIAKKYGRKSISKVQYRVKRARKKAQELFDGLSI